jgi:cysteine synthase A
MKMISKDREYIYNEISDIPLSIHEIKRIKIPNNNRIFGIEEWKNPTGSVFDRVYPVLFKEAESKKFIIPGITPVIEASTGNAGASFARCAKILSYNNCMVITHKDTPKSRTKQIEEFGCKVIFSPSGEYARGYVKLLEEILKADKVQKRGVGQRYKKLRCITKINPIAKRPLYKLMEKTLDKLDQSFGISPDIFVGVVGSGTTISGCGEYLKSVLSSLKIIVVEPNEMQIIFPLKYNGVMPKIQRLNHNIYGISPFGLPLTKLDLNLDIIDDFFFLSKDQYKIGEIQLHQIEKKLVGRSTSLVFMACIELAKTVENKNILMFFYDPSWKYTNSYSYVK